MNYQQPPVAPPAGKPKKPVYKRVWFWVLVIVAIAVIANLSGGGDADGDNDAADETTTSDQESDDAAATDDAAADEEAEADEDDAATTASIGDTVVIDDWEVVVTGVGEPTATVGSDMFSTEAQGVFVPIELTVTNTGQKAEYFFADNFVLIDDQGREFSYSSEATIYGASDGAVSLLDEINPGNSLEGILYYDIAADATIVAMEVSGGLFTAPVTIDLQ